jgi:hypothetical protein
MSVDVPRSQRRKATGGAAGRRGPGGLARTALDALRWWWAVGRHYRPERRYMRGGSRAAA